MIHIQESVLRELVDEVVVLYSVTFGKMWQLGEAPTNWIRSHIITVFKKRKQEDTGDYWLNSLTSVPINTME